MNTERKPAANSRQNPIEKSVVSPFSIPEELRQVAQWVCWRYVEREPGKKPDKRPLNPRNGRNAGVNWPNPWSSFDRAMAAYTSAPSASRARRSVATSTPPARPSPAAATAAAVPAACPTAMQVPMTRAPAMP